MGGALSSGKVADLYDRIETLERSFLDQAQLMGELSTALTRLLSDLEHNPGNSLQADSVEQASNLLIRVRNASTQENMIE